LKSDMQELLCRIILSHEYLVTKKGTEVPLIASTSEGLPIELV